MHLLKWVSGFILTALAPYVLAAAVASPFAADGSGIWVWLPDGKGTGYLHGDFGGGSVTLNGCLSTSAGNVEYDTGETAQTSDVTLPIDIGGPGWVRFVLASSTAPDLAYEIRPASTAAGPYNSAAYACAD